MAENVEIRRWTESKNEIIRKPECKGKKVERESKKEVPQSRKGTVGRTPKMDRRKKRKENGKRSKRFCIKYLPGPAGPMKT